MKYQGDSWQKLRKYLNLLQLCIINHRLFFPGYGVYVFLLLHLFWVCQLRRLPWPVGLLRRLHRQLCLERRPPCCRRPSRVLCCYCAATHHCCWYITIIDCRYHQHVTCSWFVIGCRCFSCTGYTTRRRGPSTSSCATYNGSMSWKLFRDHFNRVTTVNSWTTKTIWYNTWPCCWKELGLRSLRLRRHIINGVCWFMV